MAADLLRAGEPAPFWVVGERQTGGRGRMGRAWVSEAGNLYASLALRDPSPPERLPELSIVAAVALRQALAAACGEAAAPRLKWPNDVLIGGAKVAGVLLEGREGGACAIVGCGVNVAHHPPNTAYGATDLTALGLVTGPQALIGPLADGFGRWLAVWDRGQGFGRVRDEWHRHAHGMNGVVSVTQGDATVRGIARGLDGRGRLILECDGERRAVSAGDMWPERARPEESE